MEPGDADSLVSLRETPLSYDGKHQDLFYKVFNVSPILMAITTIESGIFVDVNQAWLDSMGYSREEVIGKSSQDLTIFADYGERQRAKQLIEENGTARDQEVRFTTKLGEARYGIFSGDIITINGRDYLLTTAYDITDRKRIHQLEENNRLLKEQLKYDKLKADFLANISHELKTPVNIIYSSLQLFNIILGNDSVYELKSSIVKQTNIMRQNCYRLIRLINNLIDITKAGSGYLKLNLDNCNIVSLVKNITFSVSEYARNNGIDMVFNSGCEEIITACDMEKVERVVLNLLSNAIKFTPRNGNVYISVFAGENKVNISVKDTGIGIPKAKQKNLFRRFYQVNSTLTRENEGSGIGLSLAKSLAELHNGDLNINKNYKGGCEFIFELPITTIRKSKKKNAINNSRCNVDNIKVEFSDIYFDV